MEAVSGLTQRSETRLHSTVTVKRTSALDEVAEEGEKS